MNLILFEPHEIETPLPLDDRRARHVLEVLRRQPGNPFDAGLVEGPRGKAVIVRRDDDGLHLRFDWREEPPPLEPITLVIGMPRPQTARKLLQEATTLGVRAIHFVSAERSEPGYSRSTLWSSGEWRRHLILGAEQAFTTRLPLVTWQGNLSPMVLDGAPGGSRFALDNYESPERLGALAVEPPVVLVLGPERGWSASERDSLREAGFQFTHLGERVLRVDTACVSAITLVRAALESM